jgi:hypothetical protein
MIRLHSVLSVPVAEGVVLKALLEQMVGQVAVPRIVEQRGVVQLDRVMTVQTVCLIPEEREVEVELVRPRPTRTGVSVYNQVFRGHLHITRVVVVAVITEMELVGG